MNKEKLEEWITEYVPTDCREEARIELEKLMQDDTK